MTLKLKPLCLFLFLILMGCSSKPNEKDISDAVYSHYKIDPCDSIKMDIKLKNTIPGSDSSRLILSLDVVTEFKGSAEENEKIKDLYKSKTLELSKISEKLYKLANTSLEINKIGNEWTRAYFEASSDMKNSIATNYTKNCSPRTNTTIKDIMRDRGKDLIDLKTNKNIAKIFAPETFGSFVPSDSISLSDNLNLTIVKSNNGWVLDVNPNK